jgi:hypothetical protein
MRWGRNKAPPPLKSLKAVLIPTTLATAERSTAVDNAIFFFSKNFAFILNTFYHRMKKNVS